MQIISFIILAAGVLAVGFSRFILGVHSANQIFYGYLLGAWSLFFSLWIVDPLIGQMVEKLKSSKVTKEEHSRMMKQLSAWTLLILVIMVAVFLIVEFGIDGFNVKALYINNIEKCKNMTVDKFNF